MVTGQFLLRSFRFYGGLTLLGFVATPLVVIAWSWGQALPNELGRMSDSPGHLFILAVYLGLGILHVVRAGEGMMAAGYAVLAAATLFGTGGLYGFLASVATLLPSLPRFDVLGVTLLCMSALMLVSTIWHWRPRR